MRRREPALDRLPAELILEEAPVYGAMGPLSDGLDRAELKLICDVLNGCRFHGLQSELRRLVDSWQRSGPSLTKMLEEEKPGVPAIGDPFPSSLSESINRSCRLKWVPTDSGNARLAFEVEPSRIPYPQGSSLYRRTTAEVKRKARAIGLFALLTLNPEWDKLAGPCARCGNYFIRRRASQKVYCSRTCGNAATAAVRTRERLDIERADKLKRAQAAIAKWSLTHSKDDWKFFVSKREGITAKFLTRAANKGDLRVPDHQQDKGGKQ